ncbi:GyrI-like domain-containing protein [Paenibacillus sp. p3-SID1389]|uniref:GyrI-like domain-containing protein n=1 Tax=Paenibacillus sp. p3-SID1389 TaxID=2916364 RepID=UPI0021A7A6AA|nr:GyrI-like domain-containing protein [Paenibacillus sp. p3-SID1389]MCT2194798.1 GyrI-like domain-containing protein [Paenibacillus sp. p3-SID1389]
MANYVLEEKDSFTVFGLGTELKSHYTDFAGINKEKSSFWQAVTEDGRLDQLKAIAENDYVFAVNEAVNNKMMYYVGVLSRETLPDSEDSRVIQFPKGEYLIVKGEGTTADEFSNQLAGIAFGQVLPELNHVAYVGGPNASVLMEQENGRVVREMWIPVVRK